MRLRSDVRAAETRLADVHATLENTRLGGSRFIGPVDFRVVNGKVWLSGRRERIVRQWARALGVAVGAALVAMMTKSWTGDLSRRSERRRTVSGDPLTPYRSVSWWPSRVGPLEVRDGRSTGIGANAGYVLVQVEVPIGLWGSPRRLELELLAKDLDMLKSVLLADTWSSGTKAVRRA